jgi:hypothetical protein
LQYFLVGEENENALDIKFDKNYTTILSSRFFVQVVNVSTLNDDRRIMEFARQIADNSAYNVTVFNPYFVFFDQVRHSQTHLYAMRLVNLLSNNKNKS